MNKIFKITLFFLSISSSLLSKPYSLPSLTGSYSVGKKSFHWIDEQRMEENSDTSDHSDRELMVVVWYPTHASKKVKQSAYKPSFIKNSPWLLRWAIYPISFVAHDTIDVPLAHDQDKYPVVIFSHGFSFGTDCHQALCQELASQGYIVVGINHTYDCQLVEFPDGRVIKGTAQKLMLNVKPNEGCNFWLQQAQTRVADVQFVLDQLECLNADPGFFYSRLDMNHIGMFGHSLGGATAANMCRLDARIKAGVNMDGGLQGNPDEITKNFNKPFMNMLAGKSMRIMELPCNIFMKPTLAITSQQEEDLIKWLYVQAIQQLTANLGDNASVVVLHDAGHLTYTDFVFTKEAHPFPWIFQLYEKIIMNLVIGIDGCSPYGCIPSNQAHSIISAHLRSFFDKHLQKKTTDIPNEIIDGVDISYSLSKN